MRQGEKNARRARRIKLSIFNSQLSTILCRPFRAHWLWVALYAGANAPACSLSPLRGSFFRSRWSLSKHSPNVFSSFRGSLTFVFRHLTLDLGLLTLDHYLSTFNFQFSILLWLLRCLGRSSRICRRSGQRLRSLAGRGARRGIGRWFCNRFRK